MSELQEQAAAAAKERDEAVAKAKTEAEEKPAPRTRGAKPLTDGTSDSGDDSANTGENMFVSYTKELVASGMNPRQARHKAAKRYPKDHQAFIDSCPEPTRDAVERKGA